MQLSTWKSPKFGKWYDAETDVKKVQRKIDILQRKGKLNTIAPPDPEVMFNLYRLEQDAFTLRQKKNIPADAPVLHWHLQIEDRDQLDTRYLLLKDLLTRANPATHIEVFRRVNEFQNFIGEKMLAKQILFKLQELQSNRKVIGQASYKVIG